MLIVINDCVGGFDVNDFGMKMINAYKEREGKEQIKYSFQLKRDDKELIEVVRKYGKDVNGSSAELKIVEIPDDVEWEIEEYDGNEWISEVHRTWG